MKSVPKSAINLILFIAILFLFPSHVIAEKVVIKQVDSFDPIIKELDKAGTDALVVFDVDYVLLVSNDLIDRPCSDELDSTFFPKIEKEIGKDRLKFLFSIIRLQSVPDLIDIRLPALLKNLQNHSVKVIALTAQGYGANGIVKDEGALRVEELNRLGVDFSSSFPNLKPFVLSIPSPKNKPPLYRDGIILTDYSPKAEALLAFLQKVKWRPKNIIFVDDWRPNVEHMQTVLKANGFEGTLFVYLDKKLATEHADPDLAQFQLDYLNKHEKWLSDEEARKLMKVTSNVQTIVENDMQSNNFGQERTSSSMQ